MPCLCHAELAADLRTAGSSTPFPEPGVEPKHPPSRRFRIVRADVALRVDPEAGTFEGQTTFLVEAQRAFAGEFSFDLEGPELTAVLGADGKPLPHRIDDAGVVVSGAADLTHIILRYRGTRPGAGLYFVGPNADHPDRQVMAWTQCQDEDARFFMPCHGEPGVRHPWSIALRGPAGFTLLSNGRLVGQGEDGDGAWARYEQAEPMPTYLFTAVFARLSVLEGQSHGLSVRYLVPPGFETHARRGMGRTPEMISLLASKTGVPYPWPRYDQVVVWDFAFGGMENTACTTMTELLLLDDRAGEHWPAEGLVVHELGHQWFGDLVTCEDWSQAWLNESFATFCEVVWWESTRSEDDATWYAWQQLTDYLEEDRTRYRRAIVASAWREPVDVFDHHLYEKGALVLRTLRAEIGEEAFWEGVGLYLRTGAHGRVHTRDLQRAMEQVTGLSLGRFFAQWITGAGHPTLEVRLGEEPGLALISVRQKQDGADTASVFVGQVTVEIVPKEGEVIRLVLPLRERERTFAVPVAGAIKTVRFDPGFQLLADVSIDGPPPWIEALSLDVCPVVAVRALRALAERGTTAAWTAIEAALGAHPHWGPRAEAASLLGRRGVDRSLVALTQAMDFELEPRARAAIATAVGSFARPDATDALLKAAAGPTRTWHEQGAILAALGRTRDPRAIPVLTEALAVRSWSDVVRQRALAGLAATEDAAVLPLLVEAAAPDRTERLCAGAAAALGALGAAVATTRPAVRRALADLAQRGPFRGRVAAVQALGRLRDPEAAPVLEALHRSDPDGRVRRQAWEALCAARNGRSTDDAVGALRARVEGLVTENDRLRMRVDRMERARRGA